MARRSDIYGYSSEESESPPPSPLQRKMKSISIEKLPTPPPRMPSCEAAAVPKMFAHTTPSTLKDRRLAAWDLEDSGPIDADLEALNLRVSKSGSQCPGLMKRPSLEDADASLRLVQNRQQANRLDSHYQRMPSNGHNDSFSFEPSTLSRTSSGPRVQMNGLSKSFSSEARDTKSLRSFLKKKKQKDRQSETATHVTRGSSASSFIGSARSKLKGYLSSYYKNSHVGTDHHKLDPQSIPGVCSEAGGYISGTKTPKYRQTLDGSRSNGASSGNFVRKTSEHSTDSSSNTFNRPIKPSSYNQTTSNTRYYGDAISQTSTIKTKYGDNDVFMNSHASKKSKNKSPKHQDGASISSHNSKKPSKTKSSKKNGEGYEIIVSDLPWSDSRPGSLLRGRYSGPVDESLLPHGKGKVILQGNESLQCFGTFEHGGLASTLACESVDEIGQKNQVRNASASPATKNVRKVSQEPVGLISDDIPFNQPNTHKTKIEQKKQGKALMNERRATHESCATGPVFTIPKASSKQSSSVKSNRSHASHNSRSKHKYALGDIAHTPRDMIIFKTNNEAIHSASLLKKSDQAFLKRSNGLWTTAILADRAMQPIKKKEGALSHWYSEWEIDSSIELEESMLFVINKDGATKIVQKRHWGKFVRRMNVCDMGEVVEEESEDMISDIGTDEA